MTGGVGRRVLPGLEDALLADQVAAMWAGRCDPDALVAAFRAATLLVLIAPGGGVWTAFWGGVRWVYAFCGESELAVFLRARGEAVDAEFRYLRVGGRELLESVAGFGMPGGVALDVGSPRPVMFPPVAGIVPDAAVVRGPGSASAGV